MIVGNRIKTLRKQQNITAAELGQAIGKDRATVYRYENGDIGELPVSVILPLAHKLNVTPFYLLGWSEDDAPLQKDLLKDPRIFNLINALIQLPPEKRERFLDALNTQLELLLPPSSDQ